MAGPPPRTPPRFVPTLTTVLDLPAAPASAEPAPQPPAPEAIEAAQAIALGPLEQLSESEAFRLEEQLLHRVLQRVDLSLEERVSDAVSGAVQVHLDSMIPALRKEIESVLRALVSEALSHELSDNNPGSTPAFGP
jgi:hypothetical protein